MQGDENAVKQFQEVQEAYDILRDPQKRAMYDQVGHQGFQDSGGGSAQGFQGGFPGGFPFGGGGFQGGFAGQDMDEVLQNMAKEFFGRQGGMGGMGGMFSSYQVRNYQHVINSLIALPALSYPCPVSTACRTSKI